LLNATWNVVYATRGLKDGADAVDASTLETIREALSASFVIALCLIVLYAHVKIAFSRQKSINEENNGEEEEDAPRMVRARVRRVEVGA
jgi:cbb3-type cytochrome oxidase subunit 3